MEKDLKNTVDAIDGGIGVVQIADDVVADIVAIAAGEVEGVASVSPNKGLAKGVRISIENRKVSVETNLIVEYGYNIPATSAKAQEKIKNTVENMTGLKVTDVNVCIIGVNMQKDK